MKHIEVKSPALLKDGNIVINAFGHKIDRSMNATEAKRKLCELRENLGDREADKAVWIAIRAIDTCTKNGFIVED